jgi:hypothetical protein
MADRASTPGMVRGVIAATRLICGPPDMEDHGGLACFARRAGPQLHHQLAERSASFAAVQTGTLPYGWGTVNHLRVPLPLSGQV